MEDYLGMPLVSEEGQIERLHLDAFGFLPASIEKIYLELFAVEDPKSTSCPV